MSTGLDDYNKFRPTRWDRVHGQSRAVSFLKKCVQNSFAPNFLIFTGPYGVGKTTLARIFTRSMNCLNRSNDLDACSNCIACKNYSYCTREYNSSNYTKLDDIRELIEDAKIQSIFSKYKFYIFDEFQMLSVKSFNIMLKTVEEPSKNAKFIAITNSIDVIPDNLVSRSITIELNEAEVSTIDKIVSDINKEFPDINITYDKIEYRSYREVINNIISNSIDMTFGKKEIQTDLYQLSAYGDLPVSSIMSKVKQLLANQSQESIMYKMLNTIVYDYIVRSVDKEKSFKNADILLSHLNNLDKNNLSVIVCIMKIVDSRTI